MIKTAEESEERTVLEKKQDSKYFHALEPQ